MESRYQRMVSVRMRRSKMMQTVGFAMLVFVIVLSIGLTPKLAFAGSNGQQVMIQVDSGSLAAFRHFKYITVQGTNQSGQKVSYYTGSGAFTQNPYQVHGWWWKGQIGIWGMAEHADGRSGLFVCYLNVPINQASDWTKLTLHAYRGSVGGISYRCSGPS